MPPDNDQMIIYRLDRLDKITSEMAEAVKSIAVSLTTLARLEVNHDETRAGLNRAFKQIEDNRDEQVVVNKDIEIRMRANEGEMPTLKLARGWMIAGITSVLGVLGLAIVALVIIK